MKPARLENELRIFFFLLYAAWVRSRAERPSVSYTKVVMEVIVRLVAVRLVWFISRLLWQRDHMKTNFMRGQCIKNVGVHLKCLCRSSHYSDNLLNHVKKHLAICTQHLLRWWFGEAIWRLVSKMLKQTR